ncbi:helix-turn-helix transcriptional regulator [Jeotgalibacillus terrae]|uniref:Helix-turn-helix transcriptional regulator n=1 Tax=Jeotgalibacillus terrae TaxID=587735 RepID=A0ABW5ZLS7_9BACL|nr:helix-turn-helix transcriptional regulator [Jeotgalibacillus terrae]MBM7581087.1 transcriptional regulator with XRE-family HTH domain [Jeotgalibacillus terrae]
MKNLKELRKDHENVMDMLNQVPGVKEHLSSMEVIMANKIIKRRIQLGLTQNDLVKLIRENGSSITQATISKVESGSSNIGSETYTKIINALGGIEDMEIQFGDSPKSDHRELAHA